MILRYDFIYKLILHILKIGELINMVNLKAKPYNLDEQGIKWVEETIANMTIEEKIRQLFVNMGASRDEEYLKDLRNICHWLLQAWEERHFQPEVQFDHGNRRKQNCL